MNTRTSLARTSAVVVCCHEGAAKRSMPRSLRTRAAYDAIGTPRFNLVPMPLDNTRSPVTRLEAQYASARRLRYMLPVQMKWMVILECCGRWIGRGGAWVDYSFLSNNFICHPSIMFSDASSQLKIANNCRARRFAIS